MTAVNLAKRCWRQGARQCLRPSITRQGPKGQNRHAARNATPRCKKTVRITQYKEIGMHPLSVRGFDNPDPLQAARESEKFPAMDRKMKDLALNRTAAKHWSYRNQPAVHRTRRFQARNRQNHRYFQANPPSFHPNTRHFAGSVTCHSDEVCRYPNVGPADPSPFLSWAKAFLFPIG